MVSTPTLKTLPRHVYAYLGRCIRIDTRSLAVFRVFVGLLIVADLLLRARNFSFYYTDTGVVPQELAQQMTVDYAFSFYFLTTDTRLIAALMVLQFLFALLLIVGYRTRTATIVSFLFVVSLDHHNPFVLSYADTLFRLLMFWAIFLPLGERWSVDALHADEPPRPYVANVATFLALSQMVVMYVVNGTHKSYSDLWTSGEAAIIVFGLDEMTFLLGDFMRNFPTLIQYGGLLWFYMMIFGWLLLLTRGRVRMFLVGLYMGGHASFALTVRIGAFAYVAMAGLVLFLQPQFWQDGQALLRRLGTDPTSFVPYSRLERVGDFFQPVQLLPRQYDWVKTYVYNATLLVIVFSLLLVAGLLTPTFATALTEGTPDVEEHPNDVLQETPGAEYIYTVAASIGVDQPNWSIFAGPGPRSLDRYYVFPARTADGELIDAFNDRNITYDDPFERPYDELQTMHDAYRERFFMNSVRRASPHNELPDNLAEHICTTYEEEYGIELTHIDMYEITERVTQETIDTPEDRERNVYERHEFGCGNNEPIDVLDSPS